MFQQPGLFQRMGEADGFCEFDAIHLADDEIVLRRASIFLEPPLAIGHGANGATPAPVDAGYDSEVGEQQLDLLQQTFRGAASRIVQSRFASLTCTDPSALNRPEMKPRTASRGAHQMLAGTRFSVAGAEVTPKDAKNS